MIEQTHHNDRGIRLELGRDAGRPVDFLEIDDNVSTAQARELEDAIWHHLPELTPVNVGQLGSYQDRAIERHSDQLALTQLLLTYHLLRKFADVTELRFAPPVGAMRRMKTVRA